jgi:hypothetical protein
MSSVDKSRATVYTERNEGIQIGEHHENVGTKSGTVFATKEGKLTRN